MSNLLGETRQSLSDLRFKWQRYRTLKRERALNAKPEAAKEIETSFACSRRDFLHSLWGLSKLPLAVTVGGTTLILAKTLLPKTEQKDPAPQINISPASFEAHRNLLRQIASLVDSSLDNLYQTGVLRFESHKLTIARFDLLDQIPGLKMNQWIKEISLMAQNKRYYAMNVSGYYKKHVFRPTWDLPASLADRASIILLNSSGELWRNKFILRSVIYHELSHFSDKKTGFLDTIRKIFCIPIYDRLSDFTGGLPPFPLTEISTHLDQLEHVLAYAPDLKIKQRFGTQVVIATLNLFFGVRTIRDLIERYASKLPKNAGEIFEECVSAVLALEKNRIAALNLELIRLGMPTINIYVNADEYTELKRKHPILLDFE